MYSTIKFSYHITLILLILLTQLSFQVFASPPFNRQEVKDSADDWFVKTSYGVSTLLKAPSGEEFSINNAYNIEECITQNKFEFPNISAVSYLSDGNTLNATVWLSSKLKDPTLRSTLWSVASFKEIPWHTLGYTMSIDVNSVYETGSDYYVTIRWDPITQTWTRVIEEGSSTGEKKIIEQLNNYAGLDFEKSYITFDLDLEKIGSPSQYNLIFSTYDIFVNDDTLCYLVDVSNLVQIPPPEYVITTSPNTIVLKPGEQTTVELQVKATTNVKSNAHFKMDPVKGLAFNFIANGTFVPPLGVGTMLVQIQASKDAEPHMYTVPLYVNFTFPTSGILRGGDVYHNLASASIIDVTNFVVSVTPPLTFDEQFRSFWNVYGGIIGLFGGGIASILAKMFFERIQEKRKSKREQKN